MLNDLTITSKTNFVDEMKTLIPKVISSLENGT